MTAPARERSHLRLLDLLPIAALGIRARPVRAALSALGIAIGVAAIVAVLGITQSSNAHLLAQIDALGTNLLTVVNGHSLQGDETELRPTAPAMIRRIDGVTDVAPTAQLTAVSVFRTDRVPVYETGGIAVRAADPSLLAALDGTIIHGGYLNAATSRYPATVLGYQAARTLGIPNLDQPARLWLGRRWFTVTGILARLPLASEIDRSALIGFPVARQLLGYDGHPTRIYIRTVTARTAAVAALLAPTADPQSPEDVDVSRPSDALAARAAAASSATVLYLGLGATALLVGAIGIANVMVVAVLERRTEIGLRRALGATQAHVAAQFVTEALLLACIGGTTGVLLGTGATAVVALLRHWTLLIPATAIYGGLGSAICIGVIASLYPAARAARLTPTEALRAT